MFTVTDSFNEKMNRALRPALSVKITYGQIDANARDSAYVSDKSTELPFSNINQTLDDYRIKENIRIGTLEKDEFLTDGNYVFSPETQITDYEVGYRPDYLGDADGNINVTYEVSTEDNINAVGISILFSELLGQYATDFDVIVGSNTYVITDNTKAFWQSDFSVTDVNTVKVVLKKWCKKYTRPKITQFNFGFYINFENDDLTKFDIDNKFNPISSQLSESTVNFTFLNINKEYNPMELGDREKFIGERQPITVSMGYDDEMLDIGYYELSGKPSIDNSTVELTGSSLVSKFDTIIPTTLYQNKTLYQIAIDLFNLAGIEKYNIDTALQNYTVTTVIQGKGRDILTDLLIASCMQYWQDGETVYIGTKSATDTGFDITSNNTQNPSVTFDNQIQEIDCTIISYQLGTTAEELTTYTPTADGTYTVSIDNATDITVSGGTLVSSTLDSVTVSGTANIQITISGKKLIENEITVLKTDSAVESGSTLKIQDNPFISSSTQAEAVIDWMFAYYSHTQAIDAKWRQNPALQTGDIIGIDMDYGNYNICIEENKLSMSGGGLSGETKGRLV